MPEMKPQLRKNSKKPKKRTTSSPILRNGRTMIVTANTSTNQYRDPKKVRHRLLRLQNRKRRPSPIPIPSRATLVAEMGDSTAAVGTGIPATAETVSTALPKAPEQ